MRWAPVRYACGFGRQRARTDCIALTGDAASGCCAGPFLCNALNSPQSLVNVTGL